MKHPSTLFLFLSMLCLPLFGCEEERPRGPISDSGAGSDTGMEGDADPDTSSDTGIDAELPDASDAAPMADAELPDASDAAGDAMRAPCPPTGPYGSSVGAIAPDVTLMDCDGVEHRLHDMCDAPVSWIFEYADWCPTCRAFAPEAQTLYERFEPMGLGAWVVVVADDSFERPDASVCAAVRARYGFTMPVLFDETGALGAALATPGNDFNLIMRRGLSITYRDQYEDDEVEGQLEAAFAAP